MLTTLEILDMVRANNGGCTDYRLAKLLNVSHTAIHNYTRRGRAMSLETATKAAELLGLPPEFLLACVQAENAPNDRICQLWEGVAMHYYPENLPGLLLQQKMAV